MLFCAIVNGDFFFYKHGFHKTRAVQPLAARLRVSASYVNSRCVCQWNEGAIASHNASSTRI